MARHIFSNVDRVPRRDKRRGLLRSFKGCNKYTLFFSVIIFSIILISLSGCEPSGKGTDEKHSVEIEQIIIAVASQPIGSLVYIADKNGYFRSEGLDIILQRHTSGKSALNSILEGKADFATTAETPIMHAVLSGNNIFAIATIGTSEKNLAVIARQDTGIAAAKDLEGKKIGVTIGTNGEFFMDSLLLVHGVLKKNIKVVNLKPGEMFDALIKEQVDAVSTWNPHLVKLQKELSKNGITFYGRGIYKWTWNIAVMQDFVLKKPEAVVKLLRALAQSEIFIKNNGDSSQEIVSGYVRMNKPELNGLWDTFNFNVTLDQGLIISLEDQTRWAIKNKLSDKTDVPNYLDYIYIDALKEVKPDSVSIIH